jgi:amino acid permease
MQQREYVRFAADVRRLRPLASVIVTVLVMSPSFVEMGTQSLSALSVLERLAASLALVSVLVLLVSGLVLHYARTQLRKSLEDVEPR